MSLAVEHRSHPVGRPVQRLVGTRATALSSAPKRRVGGVGVRGEVAIKLVKMRAARLVRENYRIIGKNLPRGADESERAHIVGLVRRRQLARRLPFVGSEVRCPN